MRNEPFVNAGIVAAVVAAILALLVNFGLPIESHQTEALMTLAAVLAPFLLAFLRGRAGVRVPATGFPVFNAATVATVVSAMLGVAVAFGFIDEVRASSLATFAVAVTPFVLALFYARSKATPGTDVAGVVNS